MAWEWEELLQQGVLLKKMLEKQLRRKNQRKRHITMLSSLSSTLQIKSNLSKKSELYLAWVSRKQKNVLNQVQHGLKRSL